MSLRAALGALPGAGSGAALRAPAVVSVLAAMGAIGAILPVASLAATSSSPPSTTVTTAPARAPSQARASLPAIERRVMCVTCKIPLIVAESPQADRERAFIRGLIADGRSESQIEHALVSQYGPTALGLPSAHGFDLTAYLAPLLAVVVAATTLALLLPRWRRRARDRSDPPAPPTLSAAQTTRLDADLARFDR